MAIDLAAIQTNRDRQLREKLEDDRGVKKALERLKERSSGFGFGARRRLLSGALRLTREMAPDVAEALAIGKETTGLDRDVEVYVRPEPVFNAFCLKSASGPLTVGLSSHLLESFEPAELQFVLGHELGHAAYDHFGLPMPYTAMMEDMAGQIVSRPTSLDLYVWCRAAELSADRVGLVCTKDPEAAANAFFKLASGLASPRIKADLEAFAAQVDSLASVPQARSEPRDDDDTLDCFSTHPYSPVRVRALVAFSKSRAYQRAVGQPETGITDEELNAIIDRDLSLMAPSYLEEKTVRSKLLRRLLHDAGLMVAAANDEIVESEISALRALLGDDMTEDAAGDVNIEKVRKAFDREVAEVVEEVPLGERARLVQHLTIIAAADGSVDDRELDEMHRIAEALEVSPTVIDQTLAGAADPMP